MKQKLTDLIEKYGIDIENEAEFIAEIIELFEEEGEEW